MSHKKSMIYTLTPGGDGNLIVYRSLRTGPHYLTKKLFTQRHVTVIQSIAVLTTICVTLLVLTNQNLARITHSETKIESTAREQASPRYVSIARVASEIIPRVIMSRDQMADVRRELDDRRRQVTRVCEIIALKRSHLDVTNMIIDTEHNISWCPIYKAASSIWMNYFAVLKGTPIDTIMELARDNLVQVSDIVRQKFRSDVDLNRTYEKMIGTRKFLIVRHPLERLLSAYRDKLENLQGREYYYKRFGRRIALKYRRLGNWTRLEPTFEEFLRFIVKERYFDEHWIPYYQTCEPCAIHYDYILRFETLERDQNFFIQDANLSEYLHDKNYLPNTNPRGPTTKEILAEYIRDIPQALLKEVYKIYENDYRLFNYSFV